MILFLDFDGVLHPTHLGATNVFSQLERLQAVVRSRPWVQVVIHSSWRCTTMGGETYYTDDLFADMLNLGPQLLGCTPREILSRWESIQAWLWQNPTTEYVIVDDMRASFPTEVHPYLISPVGLLGMLEGDWQALEERLDQISV